MEMLAGPGDSVISGHVFLFPVVSVVRIQPTYRDMMPAGSRYDADEFALLKPAGMQQFPLNSPAFRPGEVQGGLHESDPARVGYLCVVCRLRGGADRRAHGGN